MLDGVEDQSRRAHGAGGFDERFRAQGALRPGAPPVEGFGGAGLVEVTGEDAGTSLSSRRPAR